MWQGEASCLTLFGENGRPELIWGSTGCTMLWRCMHLVLHASSPGGSGLDPPFALPPCQPNGWHPCASQLSPCVLIVPPLSLPLQIGGLYVSLQHQTGKMMSGLLDVLHDGGWRRGCLLAAGCA